MGHRAGSAAGPVYCRARNRTCLAACRRVSIDRWTLATAGIFLLAWSAFKLGLSLTPFPRSLPQSRLVITGAYWLVRHPIYLAVLTGCLGLALATGSPLRLLLALILFVFFDLKARREERWLQEKYPEYASYETQVKKLIPWIY